MTNKEIIIKAITKAIKQGFDFDRYWQLDPDNMTIASNWFEKEISIEKVIFSHFFAKAFWGSEVVNYSQTDVEVFGIAWMYYLRQMVMYKEPLKYLERFLEEA